jgi:hypothetical protein
MTSHIDKMTLQLLTNKRQYQKYLTQTDPHFEEKQKTHIQKLEKYRYQIQDLFQSMLQEELENRESKTNNEMVESFQGYIHTCIKYIEMRKWDEKTNGGCYENDYRDSGDEFMPEEETDSNNTPTEEIEMGYRRDKERENAKRDQLFQPHGNLSFWGKNIKKAH